MTTTDINPDKMFRHRGFFAYKTEVATFVVYYPCGCYFTTKDTREDAAALMDITDVLSCAKNHRPERVVPVRSRRSRRGRNSH